MGKRGLEFEPVLDHVSSSDRRAMHRSVHTSERRRCFVVSLQLLLFCFLCFSTHVIALHKVANRVAYVVSLNESSKRFKRTAQILQSKGLNVEFIKPDFRGTSVKQKTISNKLALLRALEKVASGSEPWGYLFEDDIVEHEYSKLSLSTLLKAENTATLCLYLGVCLPNDVTLQTRVCGRCAHAMGFSKRGAEKFLRFATVDRPIQQFSRPSKTVTPLEEPYFDVIVDTWCQLYRFSYHRPAC